jgi:two-component system, NtrC family, sensor histidine kinase HydH
MKLPNHYSGLDLRLWFFLVSALAILVTHSALALALNNYVERAIINREADVSKEFLNSVVAAENSSEKLFLEPRPSPELVSFFNHVQNLSGMVRANVYGPNRVIWQSSAVGLVGKEAADNEELTLALDNQIIARIEEVNENENADLIPKSKFSGESLIEAYIPISGKSGKVVGVVEFYKDTGEVKRVITVVSTIIWSAAAASGFLLFLALFGAVTQGVRIINNQNKVIGEMAAFAALGQMAGAVAHSLRNPLAGIRSSAELLQHQHPEIADETVKDIQNEVERMSQHIRELLNYAQADQKTLADLNISELLPELLAKAEPVLRRQKIEYVLNNNLGGQCLVSLDKMLFGQVISNILVNAVEAMPKGGTLKVSLTAAKNKVTMEFADTGHGIPKELLEKLPQPFLTSKVKGLGLGLSLSRRIVARMSGEMRIESEVGTGTSVYLSFPVVARNAR